MLLILITIPFCIVISTKLPCKKEYFVYINASSNFKNRYHCFNYDYEPVNTTKEGYIVIICLNYAWLCVMIKVRLSHLQKLKTYKRLGLRSIADVTLYPAVPGPR